MAKLYFVIFAVVLLESYPCWVINDVNENMLADIVKNEAGNDTAKLGRINLIYPGTKWCGAGNIADNYDDLGTERETDECCRAHDYCPDIIPGGEIKHNLTNPVFYTRLNCCCDDEFYHCLKAADKKTANRLGKIYFNALQTKCFKEEYPKEKCLKKGGWFKNKCLEYNYDTNGEKLYQWFDVPDF